MNPGPHQAADIISDFEQLLLRWNRQINLVSRQGTPRLVKELIEQSRSGCSQIQEYLLGISGDKAPQSGGLDYFDLGSGGGVPGFIWHVLLEEAGWKPASCLVEPRRKRAWFLGRLARLPGVSGLRVLEGAWPETGAAKQAPGKTTLISLKALRLADPLILAGLLIEATKPPRQVTICRVFPAGKTWTPELLKKLQVAPANGSEMTNGQWRGLGTTTLPLPGERGPDLGTLLVSSYRSSS